MADTAIAAQPSDTPAEPSAAKKGNPVRRRAFVIFAIVLAVIAILYFGYQWIYGGRWVSTDNAYTNAEMAQVTPLVEGAVAEVRVTDTQVVRRGDVLVVIDPADARVALAEAEAQLAQAQRHVRQAVATSSSNASTVSARSADIGRAQARVGVARADFERARIDLSRREALARTGAVSGEELTQARNAYAQTRGALEVAQAEVSQANASRSSAQGEYQASQAVVAGTNEQTNPEVQVAQARVDQARLALERTVIRAPFDGVVARRQVAVGQRVAPGAALMVIVPTGQIYVDANFKEVQLAQVRPGQPVELTSDLYGGDVVFHGRVVGFSGGTGAAFSLIPAQNASGNWIKVVQRLPVRVALDPGELASHPLRVGLSMVATVDTRPPAESR